MSRWNCESTRKNDGYDVGRVSSMSQRIRRSIIEAPPVIDLTVTCDVYFDDEARKVSEWLDDD